MKPLKKKVIKEDNFDWVENVTTDPTVFDHYIIDWNVSPVMNKDEWFLIEVVDRFTDLEYKERGDEHIYWRVHSYNLVDPQRFNPYNWHNEPQKMELEKFHELLGIKEGTYSKNKKYWQPHDGNISQLPKNHNFYIQPDKLNESSEWGWVKNQKPNYTKLYKGIYKESGSLPNIKIIFTKIEGGKLVTRRIKFDEWYSEDIDFYNKDVMLYGKDEGGNYWEVDGIATVIVAGEYEWDIDWSTLRLSHESNPMDESEFILESILQRLSTLNEDGKKEPDMEWDLTKSELNKSFNWVKSKEDIKKYLKLFFKKIKNLPKKTKKNIIKYVLISFLGLVTVSELQKMVNEVSPEKIEIKKPTKEELPTEKEISNVEEPQVEKIRKPSNVLIDFLKKEEGYVNKGYKIGDGKITIGWGHAEDIEDSKYKLGQEIDGSEAEELLRKDVENASKSLNRLLNSWDKKGIDVEISQGMYDAMTSMVFNMGIGNFRRSDFIQMVKRGDMERAKEKIKSTSSQMFNKFPGLKKRRELESQLFS